MNYATFDWEQAAITRSAGHIAWLKEHHNKTTSEEEFIAHRKSLRASDLRGNKADRYSLARMRGQYKKLKEKYGFFV